MGKKLLKRTKTFREYEQSDNQNYSEKADIRIADKEAKENKERSGAVRRSIYRQQKLSQYPILSKEYSYWLNATDADIDNAMTFDAATNKTTDQLHQGINPKFLDQYATAQSFYSSMGSPVIMNLTTEQVKNNPQLATQQYSFVEQDPATKILQTAGLSMLGKPLVQPAWKALQVTGQALTPSNWVVGAMDAMGYTTPNWLVNGMDIATTGYFANEARKDLQKEGLNWGTVTNAALSLVPFTKDPQAIQAISQGLKNATGTVNNVTKKVFYSPKKLIHNSVVNVFNDADLESFNGFTVKSPKVTYDDPSQYIYHYNFNGMNYDIITNKNTSQRHLITPNQTYIIPENMSLSDIKNYINYEHMKYIRNLDLRRDFKHLIVKSPNQPDLIKSTSSTWERDFANSDVSGTEAGNIIQNYAKQDIDNIFLSDEYITRYLNSLGISSNNRDFRELAYKILQNDLYNLHKKAKPILYSSKSRNGGISWKNDDKNILYYGINGNTSSLTNEDMESTIFHEFGHNLWNSNTNFGNYIVNYNTKLLSGNNDPSKNLNFIVRLKDPDYAKYISDPDEFSQRIREAVRYGIQHKLTPEQIYDADITGFRDLKYFFPKDYLIKMLGSLLTTSPLILNQNDRTN